MFLADSSVWIDFFNDKATPQVEFLTDRIEGGDIFVGDLILVEVLQGIGPEREFRRIQHFFSFLHELEVTGSAVALEAARNYRTLRARGITVRKTIDTLIATRCILDGIPLLYSDRDFDPFREHLGLIDALTGD